MSNRIDFLDESHILNRVFSYIIIYYWLIIYIHEPNYVMITLPISLFIIFALFYVANFTVQNETYWILLFIFFSSCLSLIRSDFKTLIAVMLFGLTISIINNFRLRVSLNLINSIFFISLLLSIPLYYTGYSIYGFLPGQGGFSHDEFLSGRVSIFPNVTTSIYFSFIVFFINYFFNRNIYQKIFFSALALYFIYFGISRTVMIVLLFVIFLSWILKIYPLRKNWFYQILIPVFLIFLPILLVTFIEDIIYFLLNLHNEVISEYFFRGYHTVDEILKDIARTNIWKEHIRLFIEHPWGLSPSEAEIYIDKSLNLSDGGSESFLTRILVRFGFAAFFFYLFIFSLLNRAINEKDNYLYIFTYIFIFIGVSYGSFFAAYNMLFLIFISSVNNQGYKE
ncbi:MAG: hypothetical protein KAU90_05180 [Sulfurovaceae bacterium]|nr:hypothetical protein [Sulfurovaceae bacterium]